MEKWTKIALSEICDLIAGFAFKSKDFGNYDSKVIKITHITPPSVDMDNLSGVDISKYNAAKLDKFVAQAGDYVLAMTGATIGKIGRIEHGNAYINQRVLLFKPRQCVDKEYLYYALQQSEFAQYIISHVDSESAQPNISAGTIGKYQIVLPPIEIQKRIGALLRAYDEKRENNRKINDNLQQQALAIFQQELLRDGELPEGWTNGSLLDIANYLNGLAMQKFRPTEGEIGLPVLKIKELRQGSCDTSSELCSPSIKPEYIVHDGDVIFSWSGSLLVDLWCGGTCGLNQHLFKVTSDKYPKWFYYAWTAHHLARFVAIAADKATTMGHIKREELAKAEVVIPDAASMERIGGILQPMYDLIISNRIENRKLAALRDTILPQLMSGELDISNLT